MGLDRLSGRSRWVRNRVESHPRLLVRDGVVGVDGEISVFLNNREPADEDLLAPIIEASRAMKPQRSARTGR
jgi:hypothetical protein